MGRPGVAIGAAMLTAAVRIDAGAEADIGAVIGGDDGPGGVFQELRLRAGLQGSVLAGFGLVAQAFEPIGRVVGSTPAVNGIQVGWHAASLRACAAR